MRRAPLSLVLLALLSACDSSRHNVEVLPPLAGPVSVIRMAVSDELYISIQKIAEAYSSRHNVRFEISQTSSGSLPGLLQNKTIDIGVTSRSLAQDAKKLGLSYVPYAYDGAVFMAASDAKVTALTAVQLRGILDGRITNWKDVGGADREIRVIDRGASSSVRLAVGDAIFGGQFPKTKTSFVLETSESTYQALKSLKSYLAYVPMSRTVVEQFPAVPLGIGGVQPILANVPFAKYPVRLEYGVVFAKDAPPAVAEFANYLVSVDGMHQLASMGLTPAISKLSLSACHCRATDGTFAPSKKSALAGVFTIAVVPELGAVVQEKRYAGVSQQIAEELGVTTQLRHLESYGHVIREFSEGKIDAAFVGSLVYGRLHDQLGVVPVARPESHGVSHYHGNIIVRAAGPFRSFQDLKGKSIVYVPNTSAGELYLLSLTKGTERGIKGYFSRVATVNSHSDAVKMVESGKIDAAAVKDLVLARMRADASSSSDAIRVIDTSGPFPENSLVVSGSMDPTQRKRLLEVLLTSDVKESGTLALKALGADRFIPTTHDDYAKMYEMAKEAGYQFGKPK